MYPTVHRITDADALAFLISQASYIEAALVEVVYPEVQYPRLIPVDTSADAWAKSVTWFSINRAGQADWFDHNATDGRVADVSREKHEQPIEMAEIGYRYTLEELQHEMRLPMGGRLNTDKANAARRAAEEMIDDVALRGSTAKNWAGLINSAAVPSSTAPADGTGSSTEFEDKTAEQVMRDLSNLLSGSWEATLQTEMPDTLLLPPSIISGLAARFLPNSSIGLVQWLRENNIYSYTTRQPLTIEAVRGLETAGTGDTARAIAYRRNPDVLKLHLPMPHEFLDVWQTGPMIYHVPGIFRTGGVEIRRPLAIRYLDGI